MTRPRGRRNLPNLRDALLEAAASHLRTQSHLSLNLRTLAKSVKGIPRGVSHAAVFIPFRAKSDLLMALAAAGWSQLLAELGEQLDLIKLGEAYVAFAIRNEHRFRLMYDSTLWQACESESINPENRELMVGARNSCLSRFYDAARTRFTGHHLSAEAIGLRARLFASLSHGLATEFIDERLFTHIRDEESRLQHQLSHARALLELASTVGDESL